MAAQLHRDAPPHAWAPAGISPPRPPKRGGGVCAGRKAGLGATLGLVPHLLHHVGALAGAAVLTGAFGNWVLYLVGLVLSIPMLRRLRTRLRSWWAPAVGVTIFTGLFTLSAFIVGPAISGDGVPQPAEGHH